MFTKAVVFSLIAAAAAQIPSGISTSCSDFLTSFEKDSSLSSCTGALLKAGGSFNPQSASAQSVSTSLSAICASTASCSEATLRGKLSDFAGACSAELTQGANKEVTGLYDILYAFYPFSKAACSKDDAGNMCATASGSNAVNLVSGGQMQVQEAMKYVGSDAPNATTFSNTNLLFMFLTPSTSSLCTSCTRNILTSYINWEQQLPYKPTLDHSVYLAGQNDLYEAINTKCGENFLQGTIAAAGGLSDGILPSAADRSISGSFFVAAAAAMGAVSALL